MTEAKKGLVFKLAEVMGAVGPVAKAGFNKAQAYNYAKESDVAEAVRPLLAERHIWIWSDTVTSSMDPLYQTSSGATMWLTKVVMAFRFIDGETGEATDIQHYEGQGADTGDKSLPKAQSMALKYFLLKSFAMSTGVDDAEADEKVDKAAAAAGAAGVAKIAKGAVKGAERGGKSSMATAAQVQEIARLAKHLGLDADSIVPLIKRVIGTEPTEGQTLREWLGALTSDQAASIITAMTAMDVLEAEPVADGEPELIPIV